MASESNIVFLVLLAVYGIYADSTCHTQRIESNDFRYNRVTIPGALQVTSVSVVQQHSDSPCILDTTFGRIGPDVFVNQGCRATFNICYERGNTVTVACSSNDFRESRCFVGGVIKTLTVQSQSSRSPCTEGYSYDKSGSYIVVSKGCRAVFLVGI